MQDAKPYFYDKLAIHQDHDCELPNISGERWFIQCTITGEVKRESQAPRQFEGSHSTSIRVHVRGNRVEVSGNPSRFNRLDNMFGFQSLGDCVAVYNAVLRELGLPEFTRCSRTWQGAPDHQGKYRIISDGAVITEIHLTSNQCNGEGMAQTVIRALSTIQYRNSIPYLFTDSNAVTWRSAANNNRLIRPIVYNKEAELKKHLLPAITKLFGKESQEAATVERLIEYCRSNGITRHELNLKSEWLARSGFRFWGLFDENHLQPIHAEFLNMQNKLQISHTQTEPVADRLIRLGICNSRQSANATASVYLQWLHGHCFSVKGSSLRTHRARLRRIGVEIANPCDLTKFASIHVIGSRDVVSRPAEVPDWYQMPKRPNGLSLVA